MQSEKKKLQKPSLQTLLIILCAVLLLAVIVVSALAYTWRNDLKAVTRKAVNLQATVSSVDSLTSEISELQLKNAELQAELDALKSAQKGN